MKKLIYLLAVVFIAVGCASAGSNLEPAVPTTETPNMEDAVVTSVQDVMVTVQADTWPADPGVTEEVTPLQVMIENNSNMPVVVSYSNFAIITPEGEYHAAIPPFEISGRVDQLELAQEYEAFDPAFAYEGFAVAPLYDPLYGLDIYEPFGFYDYGYYTNYYDYWENLDDYNTPIPTTQMLINAMPEGVVMPGGMIKGFFYFQKVDADDVDWVRFTAELQNANTGNTFGEISIPYEVVDA